MATRQVLRMLGESAAEMPHILHISFSLLLSDCRLRLLSRMLQSGEGGGGEKSASVPAGPQPPPLHPSLPLPSSPPHTATEPKVSGHSSWRHSLVPTTRATQSSGLPLTIKHTHTSKGRRMF